MGDIDWKRFKTQMLVVIVTAVVLNFGSIIGFYYNTKAINERQDGDIEDNRKLIEKYDNDLHDDLKELKDDIKALNNKTDEILILLIKNK